MSRAQEIDLARFHRPQARERLGQLPLAVAGDAGQAEDLARVQLQLQPVQGQVAPVAPDAEVPGREDRPAAQAQAFVAGQVDLAAGHERGQVRRGMVRGLPVEDHGAVPEDGHPVGKGLDLVQLVADEDDGKLAPSCA